MIKLIKQLTLALTLLIFTNCKKQWDYTYVEGIAQDYYTKQPLSGVFVQIIGPDGKYRIRKNTNPNPYRLILDSVLTDANGYFKFKRFRAVKGLRREYTLGIQGSTYQVRNLFGRNMIVKGKSNYLIPIIIKPCNVDFQILDSTDVYDPNVDVCYKIDGSKEVILDTRRDYQCFFNRDFKRQNNIISRGVDLPYTWRVKRNNVEQNYNGFIKIEKDTIIDIVY
jgi:hypothetical protein